MQSIEIIIFFNIEHPTSNVQHRMSPKQVAHCSKFDVGCSMFATFKPRYRFSIFIIRIMTNAVNLEGLLIADQFLRRPACPLIRSQYVG